MLTGDIGGGMVDQGMEVAYGLLSEFWPAFVVILSLLVAAFIWSLFLRGN